MTVFWSLAAVMMMVALLFLLPPLLRKLLAEYAATGLPPAYLPKHDDPEPTP